MNPFKISILALTTTLLAWGDAPAEWLQFRGPGSSGVSEAANLPVEFGPSRNVLWKIAAPHGKSSPLLSGHSVLMTGHRDKERIVLCLDRDTGKLLWEQRSLVDRTEVRHPLNDPTSPTPVSDGKNVYAFFPDFGLVSYQLDGKERWKVPLGPFVTMHGVSASPILADGKVVLLIDQMKESYLAAFNSEDGRLAWKAERPDVVGGYSSPVIYTGKTAATQIVVFSGRELAGYSVDRGEKLWWVGGLGYQPHTIPVVGNDLIYVNAFGTGEQGERI